MTVSAAAALVAEAGRLVVFTGAGMSAESGVPTFRDDLTGLWARYDAERLATPEAFHADPDLVWGWYEWRRSRARAAVPNAGHRAVAALAAHIPATTVVTQNVDDLHERAGSTAVVHLHDSLFAPRCIGTPPHPAVFAGSDEPEEGRRLAPPRCIGTPPHPAVFAGSDEPEEGRRLAPPRCSSCGSLVRPGVVWFGEQLPEDALAAAVEAAADCDVLLTVGTSGVVYPAAEVPRIAARFGAAVIQVNPDPTPLDAVSTLNLRGTAATILPQLVPQGSTGS
ncbi:SIR2 family NAD-dependent protein deacylase [Dactylosporangium sp. CS-047395]|uniref:SIR2 family NAD-dependent protein deacylase n=1 Tax=Dactylosporangium sp. CS-047395 TaxID=3239936 RepID=UPI003D8B2805